MSTPEVLSLLHEQSITEDAEPGEDSTTVHEAKLGGVQKNMRMYRYTVDGCHKAFARGEHLKRHVRSIHRNEKRECHLFCNHSSSHDFLQRTSVLWKDAESNLAATITLGCTCVCTKAKDIPWLATAERVHYPSMPALRPVTFTFFFRTHIPLHIPRYFSHMYFYHGSGLSTKTPPRLPYPSMCTPYSIFCSLTHLGLMKSLPCATSSSRQSYDSLVYHMMSDDAFPIYLSAIQSTPNAWLGVYIAIWFCMAYMCER